MTKKKTSMEKLETRNETVSDGHSALIASRWKWGEVREKARELFNLIDHKCGFCKLALIRRNAAENPDAKCEHCPTQVAEVCQNMQLESDELAGAIDMMIDGVLEVFAGLKFEEIDER